MDKTKAMIVLALAILLLGTGAALASSSDDETTAAPPPDGEDSIVDMIAGLCDTGWEAGLSLELDANDVLDALRDVLNNTPSEVVESSDILKYIVEHPEMTGDDLLSLIIAVGDASQIESYTTDAFGHLYAYSDSIDTGNGYDITFTTTGEMSVILDMNLAVRDPEHPDETLYATETITYALDAKVVVHMTYDMVPTTVDAGFEVSFSDLTESNFYTNLDLDTNEVEYLFVEDYRYITDNTFIGEFYTGISGLTADEVMAILYGGDEADVDLDVAIHLTNIITDTENGTTERDQGSEVSVSSTLPGSMFGDFEDYDPLFDDIISSDPSFPDWLEVEQVFEKYGLFIHEELYDLVIGSMDDIYATLSDEDELEFYYIYGDSGYNTNLADTIASAVNDVSFDKVRMWADIDGEYQMEYSRNSTSDDSPYYITYFTGEPEDAPKTINGIKAIVQDAPISPIEYDYVLDGVGYNIWSDKVDAHIIGNVTNVSISSTVVIEGIEYTVKNLYIDNIAFDSVIISCNPEVLTYIEINYSDIGTITTIGGHVKFVLTDSYINEIQIHDLDSRYTISGEAYNSGIGSMAFFECSDAQIDISWMNGLYELVSLDFVDGIYNIVGGPLFIPNYKGIGSLTTYEGIYYFTSINHGECIAYVYEITSSSPTIYDSISIDGITYIVQSYDEHAFDNISSLNVESMSDQMRIMSPSLREVHFVNTEKIDVPFLAFEGCDNLETVVFDGPIGTLETNSFRNCTEIRTLEFNSTIDVISMNSFFPLADITELTFNHDVGTVEMYSFDGLTNLKKVTFLENVGTIESDAFSECNNLETIEVYGDLGSISTQNESNRLTSVLVHGDLDTIEDYAFEYRQTYEIVDGEIVYTPWSIHVDGHVGYIGKSAFGGSTLTDFTALGGIGTISDRAFSNSSLNSLEIGEALIDTVEEYAFEYVVMDPTHIVEATQNSEIDAFGLIRTKDGDYYKIFNGPYYTSTSDGLMLDIDYFKDDGDIAVSISWIDTEMTSGTITIPDYLDLDGQMYPVKSIGEDFLRSSSTIQGTFELVIGSSIEIIGHNATGIFADAYITDVIIGDESRFIADDFGTNFITVLNISGESPEIAAVFNKSAESSDEYVVPEGVLTLDPLLFSYSNINKVVTGDDLISLGGNITWGEGLEYLEIGRSLEQLEPWSFPNLKYIDVDPSNPRFISHEGILYEYWNNNGTIELRLVLAPSNLVTEPESPNETTVRDYTVPDTITIDGTSYPVTDICNLAFADSQLETVVVGSNVSTLNGQIFTYTNIKEIILPNDIEYISDLAFYGSEAELNVHSIPEDGVQNVYTVNGAIYHIQHLYWMYDENGNRINTDYPVPHKILISYLGNDEVLIVENGTEEVYLNTNSYNETLVYVLPQETRLFYSYNIAGDSDPISKLVILPYTAYQNSNYDYVDYIFRTYSTSVDYDIEFELIDQEMLEFSVIIDGQTWTVVDGFILDGMHFDNGAVVTLDQLFPSLSDDWIYDDPLSVSYTIEPYTVTFDHNDGTSTTAQVEHGQRVDIPDSPIRGGYVFTGWYSDEKCTMPFDFETPITGPITIYAGWSTAYTVQIIGLIEGVYVYVDGNRVTTDSIQVAAGYHEFDVEVDRDIHPDYGGYTIMFDGVDRNGSGITVNGNATITISLYVEFGKVDLTFDCDPTKGTCDTDFMTVDVNEPVDLPEVEPMAGYRFVGWTVGLEIVDDGYIPDRDTVFIAGFVPEVVDAEVSFSINASMGKTSEHLRDMTVDYGTVIDLPDVEPKRGYEFLGWTTDGDIIDGDTYTINGDTHLTAVFRETGSSSGSTATVTLHIDRSEGQFSGNHVFTVVKGDTYTLPEVGDKRGFHLVAWSVDGTAYDAGDEITINDDVTATAIFQRTTETPDTHRVIYRLPALFGSMDWPVTETVLDGQTIQLPEVTPVDGYEFVGWYADDTLIEEDYITVTSGIALRAFFSLIEPDVDPEEPDRGEGETTVTVDDDGNTIETTIWEDGTNTTVTTAPDNSSVRLDFKETESGYELTERVYDTDGDLTGSTSASESVVTIESGASISYQSVVTRDGLGNQISENTNIVATSDSGIETTVSISDGDLTAMTHLEIGSTGTETVPVGTSDIQAALDLIEEISSNIAGLPSEIPTTITVSSDDYTPEWAEIAIDSEALDLIGESGSSVSFGGEVGTITIGPEVADRLASENGTVNLSVGYGDRVNMTAAQQSAVGDRPVYDLSVSVDGESVREFEDDVTITLNYVPNPNDDPDRIRIYYVDDNGGMHVRTTVYDPATHTVTFTTDHFSIYMVGNVNEVDTVDQETIEGDGYSIKYYPGENDFYINITSSISVGLLEAITSAIDEIGVDAPDYFIGTTSGEFDAESMDLIAGLDASLIYGCDGGRFDLSSESLDYLASLDRTVTLGIDVIAESDQTDAQLDISGGRPVYIPRIMVDGEQVTDVPLMTTALFYETAEGEDPADVRLVSLNPEGGYTKVDATYEDGTIVLEGCPSGEYTVRIGDSIPGDLDGDGEVTVWDYLDMKDILNGRNPDVDMVAADIDGDGEVTVWDYLDLKDILNKR